MANIQQIASQFIAALAATLMIRPAFELEHIYLGSSANKSHSSYQRSKRSRYSGTLLPLQQIYGQQLLSAITIDAC